MLVREIQTSMLKALWQIDGRDTHTDRHTRTQTNTNKQTQTHQHTEKTVVIKSVYPFTKNPQTGWSRPFFIRSFKLKIKYDIQIDTGQMKYIKHY